MGGGKKVEPKNFGSCLAGKEILILASSLQSHSTSTTSAKRIDLSEVWRNGIIADTKSLKCLHSSKGFVLTFENQKMNGYLAFYGDKHYDFLNRVHSLNKLEEELSGFKVDSVADNIYGYTVILSKGKERRFQTIFTDGPYIVYTGSGVNSTDLKVNQFDKEVCSQKVYLDTSVKFDPKFEMKKISDKKIATKGAHLLCDLVNINGHVSELKILFKSLDRENLVQVRGPFEIEHVPQ